MLCFNVYRNIYIYTCMLIYTYAYHDYVHTCMIIHIYIYQMLDQPAKTRFNLRGIKYIGMKYIHPIYLCWDVII